MSSRNFDCEKCDEYCGDTRRLLVRVPPAIAAEMLKKNPKLEVKEHYWLCDICVKAYCKDTISDYWFERYFPRSKRTVAV